MRSSTMNTTLDQIIATSPPSATRCFLQFGTYTFTPAEISFRSFQFGLQIRKLKRSFHCKANSCCALSRNHGTRRRAPFRATWQPSQSILSIGASKLVVLKGGFDHVGLLMALSNGDRSRVVRCGALTAPSHETPAASKKWQWQVSGTSR